MNSKKQFWLSVALVDLCIVALLGVTLRSKILFPLQGINFTHVLHAHSHFAFGGWITLALLTLMIYEIIPEGINSRKSYRWFLMGIFLTSAGMLVSFLYEGYAFFSILFSTLFVFVTYAFSYVFTRDILRSAIEKAVKVLSISAVICLVTSSIGPFTLAYLMASHTGNTLLYRDSVYTYLHLQYNGFFTLAVFALFFNTLYKNCTQAQLNKIRRFTTIICISIIPTLFISYLWHFNNSGVRTIAIIGSICIIAILIYLFIVLRAIKDHLKNIPRFVRNIGLLAIIAFVLKSLLQTGTIFPALGKLVYGDRAIIIGYLHLVLLGFISLYLLAHLQYTGILNASYLQTRIGIVTFTSGVIVNEAILMVQGFGNMLMISNSIYTWLLWGVSIWLFSGAVFILISRLKIS